MAPMTDEYEMIRHGETEALTGKVTRVRLDAESGETAVIQFASVAGLSGWVVFTSDSPGR